MRILHVGLGPLGIKLLTDYLARGIGTLVAVFDSDPELVGRPVRDFVEGADPSLVVRSDLEAFTRWQDVDAAFVTTSSDLERCMETLRVLLRQRLNVVSSCEELLYPWLRHPILAQELHERCVKHGGRLIGTGVNPGFLMDTLPVVVSALCRSIERVDVWRVQDAAPRRIPFQKKIGAGKDLAAFEAARVAGTLRHVGLLESLHFVAHYLGFELDRWEESLEPVIAQRDLECGLGSIPAGHAAGVEQVAHGWVADELKVRLVFRAAIGQADPHDRIVVQGTPPLDLSIAGGVHGDIATVSVLLHALLALRGTEPGLHTMATLPPARIER